MPSLRTIARNAAARYGPALLGPARFSRVVSAIGRQPELDLAQTRALQLRSHAGARTVDSRAWMPAVFSAYYGETDVNLVVPGAEVASACSFIPYYRGFTHALVYNFFKSNYGIRDPIVYRYTVFHGRDAIWCRQYLLAADQILDIEDPAADAEGLPPHGVAVLEAFHPRIATPTRQLRFFGMYRDGAAGVICGTHSIFANGGGLPKLGQPSHRAYGLAGSDYFYHSALGARQSLGIPQQSREDLQKLASPAALPQPGYITHEAPGGCPASIWHDGPTTHYVKPAAAAKAIGASSTAFHVPDFAAQAPFVLVSSSQVGFRARRLAVHLISEAGDKIATKAVELAADDATIDLRSEFSGRDITGPVNVVFEFDRDVGEFVKLPEGMVHAYYRSATGCGDQVHSHRTVGYHDDPFRRARSYRCRKFAPYLHDPNLEFTYSIVNLGFGAAPISERYVRVRLMTDRGSEFVMKKDLSMAGVTNITAAEIFGRAQPEIDRAAIVQIEHETTNFAASWYAMDRSSRHLAADHFTGG